MVRGVRFSVACLLTALALCVPLMALPAGQTGAETGATTGDKSPAGYPPNADLPQSLRKKNIPSLGLGCCVMRSIDHAAHWQNLPGLYDFPEWMVENRLPGGGWPSRMDKLIPQICQDRGTETPAYLQIESNDLEILKLCCKTRRMVCVTYAYSPTGRYNGQRISHMVNLVHADDEWFGVLDNNYPDEIEWMTPEEFLPVYHGGNQSGWSIIFLAYPPPPLPKNLESRQ